MVNSTVLHYRILEKIGEGGMGVVYKAEDTKLKRTVALKFLSQHLSKSEEDKARFIQEAQAASALNHPNVCTIHDIQEYEGQLFFVMELVDGQTLRERRSTITPKQAIEIGIQIADGLAAAHEKGIIHRDIKPENIMIRRDGIVQIMDFGLAKLRGNVTRLTKEGSTIGTAGYMSPEQIQGQTTDHRSDIFSYGVVLYELIAGEPPFKGVHETALMYEIVNMDPQPMAASKPEIDPELDAIVLECLEKDPNERTQSVKQVSIDLKRFKRESTRVRTTRPMATRQFPKAEAPVSIDDSSGSRVSKFIWPVLCGLLGVGLLAALFFIWNGSKTSSVAPLHLAIDLRPSVPNSAYGNSSLDLTRDGKAIAYLGGDQLSSKIYVRRLDQFDVTPLSGTDGANDLCFSPDGEWIAFVSEGRVKKLAIGGGAPQVLCLTKGQTRGLCWASDGFVYYGHITDGIQRVSAGGGNSERVTSLDSTQGEISHRYPQVLPDGKTVIYTIKQNSITSFNDALIAAEDMGSHHREILVRGGTYGRYLPTGHIIYMRGDFIYGVPFNASKIEVTGPSVQLLKGGWLVEGAGVGMVTTSVSGTLIYAPEGSTVFNNISINWLDRQGRMLPLLDTLRAYAEAAISPDGERLALDVGAANDDIWIYQIKRGILTRLTFGGGNSNLPTWTPDGKYVVYQSEKGGVPNLYRKQWDGNAPEERLTRSESPQTVESFSPDGKYLTYFQNGDIWIVPMDSLQNPRPFIQTKAGEYGSRISPDGRWMCYASDESGHPEIYVVPFPGHNAKWQISVGGGAFPFWSHDGKELFYSSGGAVMKVDVAGKGSFDYSTPKRVCAIPPFSFGPFDVSADGTKFLVGATNKEAFTLDHLNVITDWFSEVKAKFNSGKN